MALMNYGVVKGHPIARHLGSTTLDNYHIHLVDDDYRITVNVVSKIPSSGLLYLILENYDHPLVNDLKELPAGFTYLESKAGGLALDYIRGKLFEPSQMVRFPIDTSGSHNELRRKIDDYVQQALKEKDAMIYAFGERRGPEPDTRDKYSGFIPANGIHNIHMNQGNISGFQKENGAWQDGGMMLHLPSQDRWVPVFIAFQSQCWHTEEETGNCISKG